MRRVVPHAFRIVSAVLCVAVAALWARSYWRTDIVKFGSARLFKAASGGGGVMLESLVQSKREGDWRTGTTPGGRTGIGIYTETRQHYFDARRAVAGDRATRWEWLAYPYTDRPTFEVRAWVHVDHPILPQIVAVSFKAGGTYSNVDYHAVETWYAGRAIWIPYWLPTALTLMPPFLWLGSAGVRRRRERRRLNLCERCGYDLRASPGRCPECGTVAAAGGPAGPTVGRRAGA